MAPVLTRLLSSLPASPQRRALAAAVLRLLAFGAITLALTQIFPQLTTAPALFAAALLTGSAMLTRSWPARLIGAVLTWSALMALGVWVGYELKFGPIGYDDFIAIFQTDANEAAAYLDNLITTDALTQPLFVALAFLCAGPWRRSPIRTAGTRPWRRSALAMLLWGAAIATLVAVQPVDIREQWQHFIESVQDIRAQRQEQQAMLAGGVDGGRPVAPAKLRGTIILILGESMTRRHLSLYGYSRPTTPHLDSIAEELFVHKDTIAPHSHTTLTVPPMFGAPLGRNIARPLAAPLIGSFRRSGVKTFWYSNQNEIGAFENPVTLIARTSDVWQFQKTQLLRVDDTPLHDDWLVPRLEEALKDPAPAKFVTLHFYAPHWPYCEGFPASAKDLAESEGLGGAFFGRATDWSSYVNCYDNAIRHVDGLWGQIIDRAREASEPTAVVIVSDHGENPAAMTAHDEHKHSGYQVEVPLVMYVNDAGRRAWQPQLEVLRSHLDAPYLNASLGNSLLDLAGADGSLFDARRSLFSTSFEHVARTLFSRDPDLTIHYDTLAVDRKDSLEIARNTLRALQAQRPQDWAKIRAHDVNSIGKLLEAKDIFAGVSLDVSFDATRHEFVVCDSFGKPVDLTLAAYLKAARDRPGLRLWLAWRGIRHEHLTDGLAALAALDRQYRLQDRTVVETGNDAIFPELQQLARRRIMHAFRLPEETVDSCLPDGGAATCARLPGTLARSLKIVGANALTFEQSAEPFIRQHERELKGLHLLVTDLARTPASRDFAAVLPALDPYMAMRVRFQSTFDR